MIGMNNDCSMTFVGLLPSPRTLLSRRVLVHLLHVLCLRCVEQYLGKLIDLIVDKWA